MISARERREADLFYADLFEPAGPRTARSRERRLAEVAEDEGPNPRARVVFYDKETLRFCEGWTRKATADRLFLIDKSQFDRIRADGRRRSHELDVYLATSMRKGRAVPDLPLYIIDDKQYTVSLDPRTADWDDLLIELLIDAAKPLKIQPMADQEQTIQALLKRARDAAAAAARAGASGVSAREFAAFFVLDTIRATLTMTPVPDANIKMEGNHARIDLGQLSAADRRRMRAPDRKLLPGSNDAELRVIGNVHTHVLVKTSSPPPSGMLSSKPISSGSVARVHEGVSDVDIASARDDHIVVYAADSKWLHRANLNGTKNDKLSRPHNVLREALRVFGGEPD